MARTQRVAAIIAGVCGLVGVSPAAAQQQGLSVSVRLFVVGDEFVTGTAFPLTITCSRPGPSGSVSIPPASPGFDGVFTLRNGNTRTFTVLDFPMLTADFSCLVGQADSQGYTVTMNTAIPPAYTGLPGSADGAGFRSAPATNGQIVNIANTNSGELIVGLEAVNEPTPPPNYILTTSCDKGGPKDVYQLRAGARRVTTLITGTNCLTTVVDAAGGSVSITDNSGNLTDDGRIAAFHRPPGCGSPSQTVILPSSCWSGVIVRITHPLASTTTTTAIPIIVASAPTTALPAAVSVTTVAVPDANAQNSSAPTTTGVVTNTTQPSRSTTTTSTTTSTTLPLAKATITGGKTAGLEARLLFDGKVVSVQSTPYRFMVSVAGRYQIRTYRRTATTARIVGIRTIVVRLKNPSPR